MKYQALFSSKDKSKKKNNSVVCCNFPWLFSGQIVVSSPEHEVLMVSYCDQSMSVVRRPSCVVRRQQFVLKANSS